MEGFFFLETQTHTCLYVAQIQKALDLNLCVCLYFRFLGKASRQRVFYSFSLHFAKCQPIKSSQGFSDVTDHFLLQPHTHTYKWPACVALACEAVEPPVDELILKNTLKTKQKSRGNSTPARCEWSFLKIIYFALALVRVYGELDPVNGAQAGRWSAIGR